MADRRRAGSQDVFPTTRRTWLGRAVADGQMSRAVEHVMEVYREPLTVYCKGSSFRRLGEPVDLVQGFFADRLSRSAYLDRWRTSGRPLRYWLIVGFKHYLLEESRRQRRDRRHVASETVEPASVEEDPERAYNRSVSMRVVQQAAAAAERDCADDGLETHWRIFSRHFLDEAPYGDVAREFGVEASRAAVMARTAATRFRRAMRDLVAWDGATESDIEAEIRALMEAIGR